MTKSKKQIKSLSIDQDIANFNMRITKLFEKPIQSVGLGKKLLKEQIKEMKKQISF